MNKIQTYLNENPWIVFLLAAGLGALLMGVLTTSVINGLLYFGMAVIWAYIQTRYNP